MATSLSSSPTNSVSKKLLNQDTLASLPSEVAVPTYDRSSVEPGILHVGVGNFHRAHMAAYVDDLLHLDFGHAKEWGIVGAGIMPKYDQPKRDMLEAQQWLQTVVEHDASKAKPRVLGCMTDFLPIDTTAIQTALQNPAIKIVSLTVTEGGYFLNDGQFDAEHPQIKHDIANQAEPKTIFGLIVQGARYRKENQLPVFTCMSCDNIPHNGDIVKSVVLGLAKAQDPTFATWLEENMAFPNSMVDRITPATTKAQIDFVQEHYQYQDACPVFCEPFRQWVLEDSFSSGRPALDQMENVTFVDDVTPYEFMKIRILNGGHASLCYPAALLDLDYVHSAMEQPTIRAFLEALEQSEIIPTVPPVPDTVLTDYWKTIAGRFENPTLNDTIGRNCYDGMSRQPKFIVPVIRDNLEKDGNNGDNAQVNGMALVSAMWCRYCLGTTESGKVTAPNDPEWDRLQALSKRAKEENKPILWLEGLPEVYGTTSLLSDTFSQAFTKALQSIYESGVENAMQEYVTERQKHQS